MSYDVQHPPSGREATNRHRSPGGDESAGADPFALHEEQDRSDEPSRRRRIPRACESCRKRKIRCDGNEVCRGCQANSLLCVYRDADGARLVKEHIEKFDTRLQKMEGMLANFLTSFAAMQSKGGDPEQPNVVETEGERESLQEEETRQAEADAPIEFPVSPPLSFAQGNPERGSGRPGGANRSSQDNKRRKVSHHRTRKPIYADAYGELHEDEWGQLRYIGLSSTMSVVDVCMPFREHINRGLENKGYDHHNNFLGPAPSVCEALTPKSTDASMDNTNSCTFGHLPPASLVDMLLPCFYDRLYFIHPIINRADFEAQLAELKSMPDHDIVESDFLPVLYSLLAVAALNIPENCQALEDDALSAYRTMAIGATYFALSCMRNPLNAHYYYGRRGTVRPTPTYPRRSLNPVITLVLQAAYLGAIGSQAEAWILVGQAVRLGQDLGLHRSASHLGLPVLEQERRRYAWWCIYSLDRALSAALGRPLAIRDADCDVELPQAEENESGHDCTGFVAILNLRRILGDIVTTVASVRTAKAGRHVSKIREMRAIVVGLNTELQTWATKEVPDSIKSASDGQLGMEKFIALSGHFCALLLLYRFFMGNPHRPSPLKDNEALFQCARAATNCIRVTEKIISMMPICADLVFHTQHLFTSAVILLQCIRRSDDANFIQQALDDVELALRSLRQLQRLWPGATRLTATVEEYLEFTLKFIENGVGSRCAFHHEKSDFTGLEMRDGSGKYPADWAQLALRRLPVAPLRNHRLHKLSQNNSRESSLLRDHGSLSVHNPLMFDLTGNNDPNAPIGVSAGNDQSTRSSPPDPNLFRFALPQKRSLRTGTTNPSTPATHNNNRPVPAKLPYAVPPPVESHQGCLSTCRNDDPTWSWDVGMTDGSFIDNLLVTGIDTNGDLLLDSSAYFTGEGLWNFQ